MSRADIACYLGLSRETVSRGLMKFQKEGAIKVLGKLIRLEDLHQLTKLAGE